jgi:NADH dehydrogenase [ubiquinone] 1 alpha subcomplex assembly factor 5
LSNSRANGTSPKMSEPNALPMIFDNKRRQALRNRAANSNKSDLFLWQHIADDLAERLDFVSRNFEAPLVIGPLAPWSTEFLPSRFGTPTLAPTSSCEATKLAVEPVDEAFLPYAEGQFDLIIAAGTMDSVNDLPGMLVQIRRCLRPDGLFLGTLFGAGTLGTLKSVLFLADGERPKAHIHPQIELKAASDLLNRAGFTLPVADRDRMEVRYRDWRRLVFDLRAHGIGNALAGPRSYAGRAIAQCIDNGWQQLADNDGRVSERFELLHLSGWSPSPNQPKPARRGSGKVSLAQILPDKSR